MKVHPVFPDPIPAKPIGPTANYYYRHQSSPGLGMRLIQKILGLLGMKRLILKLVINRKRSSLPSPIPFSVLKRYKLACDLIEQRPVWTLSSPARESDTVVLYLHGGAFIANITTLHWRQIKRLMDASGACFIVADYPLAPASDCLDTYRYLEELYSRMLATHPAKRLVFMGDSAGGGLALGLAQLVKDRAFRQPDEIILISPWLDLSLESPDLARYDRSDKILSIRDLKRAATIYAGNLPLHDQRLSPIYGDLEGLGTISIFCGTHDLLYADALALLQKKRDISFFEYPGAFHDWVLITGLKESKDVVAKVAALL